MEYNEIYNDYFLWNDALWKYYFVNNDTDESILYVNDDIIRDIGSNTNDLRERYIKEKSEGTEWNDYLDFFYDSIILYDHNVVHNFFYCGYERNGDGKRTINERFLNQSWLDNVRRAYNRKPIQTTAIIEFARALASIRDKDFEHKCPCLCYVIFLILEYGRSRSYNGVITKLREISGLENVVIVPEQFKELFRSVEDWSKIDGIPRFSADNIRGEQEFVGVLRYHLVLNRAELTELEDALYKYNIDWDESETPYRNFVYNHIFPIITKDTIKKALSKEENYVFFYNLFRSFAPEDYTPSYELPKSQRGHFFLLYDREEKTFLLKADVRAYKNEQRNDFVAISNDGERECGLYSAVYLKGEIDIDNYMRIRYEDDKLKVIPIQRDWLFFIMSGKYFQQVLSPTEDQGCLIITNKSSNQVKDVLKQDSLIDYTQPLKSIFGERKNVFYVEKWKANIVFTDKQEYDDQEANEVPSGPKLTNGILNPAFKRCYLPEGLPVIQGELPISVDDVTIYEDEDCKNEASNIKKELIGQNIIRLSLTIATNKYQELYVVVSGEQIGIIRVKGSNTTNRENSIWYDSWGCATVIKDDSSVLCDNSINYEDTGKQDVNNEINITKASNKSLIPLLKSYAYARKESHRPYLLDRDISKIVNYMSLVEQWNINKDEIGYVKYQLINLGILSMATDDCGERRFEVNNPRLVPIGNDKYLLLGAYTFSQFEEINHSSEISWSESVNVPTLYSDLLIVGLKNLKTRSISGIPVSEELMADVLLKICQKMDIGRFKTIFMNTPEEATDMKREDCKFGARSKDHFFNYIQERGKIYALYQRKDNTFQQIPTSLQKLYVRRVNRKPLMMWDEDTSTISFAWEMGIPYYVERALCLLSLNVGVREKVFGINNCVERNLYNTITSYKLLDPKYKEIIFHILSNGDIPETEGIMIYQKYKGNYSLFYSIKEEEDKSGLFHEFVLLDENVTKLVVRYAYGKIISAFGWNVCNFQKVDTEGSVNKIISDYIKSVPLKWVGPWDKEIAINPDEIKANYNELQIIKNR